MDDELNLKSAWIASDAEQKVILEEYKTLRQEILNHQQFVHQINTAGIAIGGAIAAILAFGSGIPVGSVEKGVLLGGLTLFYFPLILAQVYRRRKEMRIGRYIEIVIEPRILGLYWESAWNRERDKDAIKHPALFEGSPLLMLQLMYGLTTSWIIFRESQCFAVLFLVFLVLVFTFEVWQLVYRAFAVSEFENEWNTFKKKRFSSNPAHCTGPPSAAGEFER